MKKQFTWFYKGLRVETRLVKNGVWRWYSSAYRNTTLANAGDFAASTASNAITARGAKKKAARDFRERGL